MARHVLSLGHVRDEDYGNYSCVATNSVGSDRCVAPVFSAKACIVLTSAVALQC